MEFTVLNDLLTYINDKYTAAGGDDEQLITAAELLKGVKGLQEFLLQRGLKVLDTTGDFALCSGLDATLVIVKNIGIYQFEAEGVADGLNSFAASGGGAFTIISRFPPKTVSFSITLDSPYALVIPAGYSVNKILIISALANTVQIGTTSNGSEIELDLPVEGSIELPLLRPLWYLTDTTLYFSGATSQVNFKILFD